MQRIFWRRKEEFMAILVKPCHNIWVISGPKELFGWTLSGVQSVERGFLLHSFCQLHWSCCTGSVNTVLWPSRISRRVRCCLETRLRDITALISTRSAKLCRNSAERGCLCCWHCDLGALVFILTDRIMKQELELNEGFREWLKPAANEASSVC